MALVGIQQRKNLCKICCSFNDEVLNEITLDILLKRGSYEDIKKKYSPLLPKGVKPLNDMNINNHRKHSDPSLLADYMLQSCGEPLTEGEAVSKLYSKKFKEELDKKEVLKEVYKERIGNLQFLQKLLKSKTKFYEELNSKDLDNYYEKTVRNSLEREIKTLIKSIDEIQESIQNILIKELSMEKGLGNNTYINQNFNIIFQDHLKSFLDEIIPYLLLEVFSKDVEMGKKVVQFISVAMDRHLDPALQQTKLLNRGLS